MNAPNIHRKRRTLSASKAIETQDAILTRIKTEDDVTFNDVGRVLGKSEGRAAAYTAGASAMDLPTFLAACAEWQGRFADPILAMMGGRWADGDAVCTGDEQAALTLATLLPAIIAIEDDGMTEAFELRPQRR